MTDTMWTPDDQAESLRAIALWGYVDREIRVPTQPSAFPGYASALQQTRLLGPLLAAASLGDVALPDELRTDLVERQQAALAWCILLESRLLEVRDWFDAAGGIEHRVIKGPAIAHLDALDASVRTFADIDLLITTKDIDRTVQILTDHGATRPWAQRRPGFDRRFAKSVTMTFPDGMEFDLHRTLADGVFGHRIPLDDLFANPDTIDIGGVTFQTLSPTDRMLHSAYHLLLGSQVPKIMSLRDMVGYFYGETAVGDLSDGALGVQAVTTRAAQWRGLPVLAIAIDQVVERLGDRRFAGKPANSAPGILPDRWARWRQNYVLGPEDIATVERHRSEGSSLGVGKLDVVRDLPDVRSKAAYLFALAWPTMEHLRSRGLRRREMLPSGRKIIKGTTG